MATLPQLASRRLDVGGAPRRDKPAGSLPDCYNPSMGEFTHFDASGASRMVDTSGKPETPRLARASALVRMSPLTLALIRNKGVMKGDVLEVARLAGILAAKKTGELIPLCHPLPLTGVTIDFSFEGDSLLRIEATAKV